MLALIYMRSGRLESPIVLSKPEELALNRLESNLGGCVIALESLKGSLVLFSHTDSDSIWSFKHPTIGDAYATILAQNPELLGIFLLGITPDKLIEQVTCGDVGIEKAVIIPKVLYPDLLLRLHELKNYKSKRLSGWRAEDALQRFLTHRCSKEFLSLYIEQNPGLLEKVSKPGLYLSAVSEVRLAVRINEFGLLPEEMRERFVLTVSEYAILGDDLYALDNLDIQSMFRNREFEELRQSVRTQLLPKLTNVRQDVQHNYSQGNESPEE